MIVILNVRLPYSLLNEKFIFVYCGVIGTFITEPSVVTKVILSTEKANTPTKIKITTHKAKNTSLITFYFIGYS
jgi:hypothetical protein